MTTYQHLFNIGVTLEDQFAFRPWRSGVWDAASGVNAGPGIPYGMMHQVKPAVQYQAFPGVVGPVVMDAPVRLVGAAITNAAIQNYKDDLDAFNRYDALTKAFKTAIILSISVALRRDITNVLTNTVTMTALEIMAHFEALFGEANAAAIETITTDLLLPLTGYDLPTYIAHSARFVDLVQQLEAAHQPLSASEQMNRFGISVQAQPVVADAITRYIQQFPDLAQRNLAALIAFVQRQVQNVPAQAAMGLANATAAVFQANTHADYLRTAALLIEMQNRGLVVADPRHSGPRNGAAPRNAPAAVQPAQRQRPQRQPRNMAHYCWHHGYGHLGRECLVMINNPNMYSQAKLNARNPGDVAGGHV